jgi:hypothetical protein
MLRGYGNNMTKQLDKDLLIHKMNQRQESLLRLIERDITGNTLAVLEAWRETKYWKESILRGEFDEEEN